MRALWIVLGAMIFALLQGSIWLGGWFFGLSLLSRIILSAAVLGTAVVTVVVVQLLGLQRARGIERGLVAQGARDIAGARPDTREQIQALHAQVQRAIAALKQSRLGGRGGRAALYALPWYVIIGPPGAGKTTAIRHSGLTFPLDQGAAYRGSGGTRNCDWWFTNDAILLDTAGRYTTAAGAEPEWLEFLELLRKHRKRMAINGVIVAVSLSDLVGANEEQIDAIAKQIRVRLDEVTTHLKLLVPVYLALTKVDLVAGFSECWGDLRKSERGQIWGATFPVNVKQDARALFEPEFDLLVAALRGRAVRRLATERSFQVRQAIVQYPVEVAALKERLASFVSVLFQKNAFQETPVLRGVYLTSGTQNVKPSARVVEAMSAALGLKQQQQPNQRDARPPVEPKSYFLTDLFFKIIFPDRNLGGQTEGERRRQTLLRGAIAAVTMMSASGLVMPAGCTFLRNRELVRSTSEIGAALQSLSFEDPAVRAQAGEPLGRAELRLRQLDEWRESPPVQLRWGMYTGTDLYAGLRDAYVATIHRALIGGVRADLEDRLRGLETAPVRTSENYNRDFDTLKLYLMLGDPAHMDPEWATPRMIRHWELTSHTHTQAEGAALAPHVLYVCELLKRGELQPWKLDEPLVRRARSILVQVPQVDRLYETLVRDANTEIVPIRREAIFYGSIGPFVRSRNGVKVSGAYTRQGWERVKVLLGTEGAKLTGERWVLGEEEAQVSQAIGKLRELYFERFKNAWRDFLADLEIVDPGNAEFALAELNAISEPEWPYLRLIRALNDNVTLDVDEPGDSTLVRKVTDKAKELLDGGAAKGRTISPVERAFKPILRFGVPADSTKDEPPMTGLAQWEALVAKLVGALTDFRDGASTSDPKQMGDVFQEAFRATSSLLSEQDGFTRPLLSPLLMQPITLAWANVVKDAGVAAGATWEVSVWSKWKDKLEGKYPFASSSTDAALDDFLQFFGREEGGLWAFYDESLKATLDRSGNTFTPSRRFKSQIGYTGPFLDVCLKRGREIAEVLYPPKSEHAAVDFDINLHSVSPTIAEVTFEVDGTSRTYKNEPEQWLRVQWPGKASHGARLRVRGASGLDEQISRPGDFGLFRLLDAAEVAPGRAGGRADGPPTLVATWDLRAARAAVVKLDLRPVRNEHPLAPGYFKGYTCPRSITAER